ncbi:MAG: hypothetical protein KDC48_00490 [Planctomycetes bacterium]|nr:hypothetical protein [Planctomycetota bacterium]
MHSHDHGAHAHRTTPTGEGAPAANRRRLLLVLVLALGYAVIELLGGWLTGSLALLADAGFRTPTVVAAASTPPGRLYVQAALITRGVPDHVDLATWAASPRADDDAVARATFDAAEALVRRAHGLGIALLGAKYRNLLVPTDGCDDAAQVVVLDQPSLERSNSRRLHERDDALLAFDRERYGRGR